jgi:hypothetical protein
MCSFAKKTQVSRQAAQPASAKSSQPFFNQSHTPEPFFKKQPEDQKPGSEMKADKRLSRLDFSEVTRPPSTARLRVPSAGEIQGMLSSGSVDETIVLSRVRKLLDRMNREGRLKGLANLDSVMYEIFPIPGYLDQAAYERYIDPADRTMVYQTVREAIITPHKEHRAELKLGLLAAAGTAAVAAQDVDGLKEVFGVTEGSEWLGYIYVITAQQNYLAIQTRLNELAFNIESKITTDYNLDAREAFVSGWASNGVLHVRAKIVTEPLATSSKATFIHEAAHLVNSNIKDYVYDDKPGFDTAAAETKINNAAHYEELPKRHWGVSAYKGQTFTPGLSNSGKSLTAEEKIRQKAVNYFRMAWHSAVMAQDMLRDIRKEQLDGKRFDKGWWSEAKMNTRLSELSQLMDLTLHEQWGWPPEITLLDVTTAESIAREVHMAGDHVAKLSKDQIMSPLLPQKWLQFLLEDQGVIIAANSALKAHGSLLGDPNRDLRLLFWLHDHYDKVWP